MRRVPQMNSHDQKSEWERAVRRGARAASDAFETPGREPEPVPAMIVWIEGQASQNIQVDRVVVEGEEHLMVHTAAGAVLATVAGSKFRAVKFYNCTGCFIRINVKLLHISLIKCDASSLYIAEDTIGGLDIFQCEGNDIFLTRKLGILHLGECVDVHLRQYTDQVTYILDNSLRISYRIVDDASTSSSPTYFQYTGGSTFAVVSREHRIVVERPYPLNNVHVHLSQSIDKR